MFCTSGILIFIFAENNYSIYAHSMLIKTPLLHQSFGPCVLLSLSLSLLHSLRLFLWSAEALWVHFPARASKTLSRRHPAPSPHWEGAWGLREQSKPHAGTLLAFCVNQGISASFSLIYFLIGRLWTTRFQSIKGPQQRSKCLLISWSQSPSAVILESKKIKFVTVSLVSHLFSIKWWDWMPLS